MSQTIIIQADYLLPSVFHQNMGLSCLSWKSGNCFGNCNIVSPSSHHSPSPFPSTSQANKVALCVKMLVPKPDDLSWWLVLDTWNSCGWRKELTANKLYLDLYMWHVQEYKSCRAWWCMPVIPALGMPRKEDDRIPASQDSLETQSTLYPSIPSLSLWTVAF